MAKIVIYEDGESDLISRYSRLTAEHEIHVRHSPRGEFGPSSLKWDYSTFKKRGFDTSKFQNGYGTPSEEAADLFFVDGLNGYCFEIVEQLPRERTFINSDSATIHKLAKERGFNFLGENDSVEGIVKKVLEQNK